MAPSPLDQANGSLRVRARGPLLLGPLLLILALLAYQCWSGYEAARREARITVVNLADVLAQNIDNSLERIRADLDVFAAMLPPGDLNGMPVPDKRRLVETGMAQSLRGFDAVLNYRAFDVNGVSVLGAGRAEGEFVSAIDFLPRTYAFRALKNYPLTVVVAISANDYLKPWYFQAGMTALVALLLGAVQIAVYHRLSRAYGETVALAEELRATNTNLQRSNAELEEFAYIASHDLQTPLRNIASFSQLLERRYKPQLGTEGKEFVDFIVTNATRMSGLIQDLLAYARVSRPEQGPEPVAADDVLRRVLADLRKPIAEAGARIDASPLPTLTVSEHQLSSLLGNLIENAIKYRAPGRPPTVSVSAVPDDPGWWRFTIADDGIGIGIGIAEEHWEKIFAIFQRLHPVDAYPGTGIGLALCRRIVHRWGGRIWVTSAPGQGSAFHFTAPA